MTTTLHSETNDKEEQEEKKKKLNAKFNGKRQARGENF